MVQSIYLGRRGKWRPGQSWLFLTILSVFYSADSLKPATIVAGCEKFLRAGFLIHHPPHKPPLNKNCRISPHLRLFLKPPPVSKRRLNCRACLSSLTHQEHLEAVKSEENSLWPSQDVESPLHVKITRKGDTVERKHVSDYTKSLVFVNDTYVCATKEGFVPLSGAEGWKDHRDDDKMLFTLLDEFRFERPGYMHLFPPVTEGDEQRLWVTNFGMTTGGSLVGIDVSGRQPLKKCKAPFVWPNAVEYVPAGHFSGIDTACLLVADGFLVPGKTKGNVWLVTDPGGDNEVAVRLAPTKASWFYHRAVPLTLNGHEGILTARARLPILPFSKPQGELVWIEKPITLRPTASWNLPWREVVLADGPDVMFETVDLDPEDGTVEIFSAEFFGRRLTMHSLAWDDARRAPVVVERHVIDDQLGQAYSVAVAPLTGPNSHLIVTTHEYAPDPSLDRSGPLYWIPGTGPRWTYTSGSPAPMGSAAAETLGNRTVGGSLFAYNIPRNWRTYRPSASLTEEAFAARLPALFRRLDAAAAGYLPVDRVAQAVRALGLVQGPADGRSSAAGAGAGGGGVGGGVAVGGGSGGSAGGVGEGGSKENLIKDIAGPDGGAGGGGGDAGGGGRWGREEIGEFWKSGEVEAGWPAASGGGGGGGGGGGEAEEEALLQRLLAEADWDGSGQLDFDQFRTVMSEAFRRARRRRSNVWAEAVRRVGAAVGEGMRGLESAMSAVDARAFEARLPEVFRRIDRDGSGAIDMEEMERAMQAVGVTCSDVELAAMFVEADWDGNGLIDYPEFVNLMLRIYHGVGRGAGAGGVAAGAGNLFGAALSRLEAALKQSNSAAAAAAAGAAGAAAAAAEAAAAAAAAAPPEPAVWTRSTLASGFRVKRASINPGAPGFAYAFHPHESMRAAGRPPHILLAGDCSDAAYVFRPVHNPTAAAGDAGGGGGAGVAGGVGGAGGVAAGGDAGGDPREAPRYDLVATLAFEGTVGSVAVGRASTAGSVDDGWAKFFSPVYETDRIYVFKCGGPPTEGIEPSW